MLFMSRGLTTELSEPSADQYIVRLDFFDVNDENYHNSNTFDLLFYSVVLTENAYNDGFYP